MKMVKTLEPEEVGTRSPYPTVEIVTMMKYTHCTPSHLRQTRGQLSVRAGCREERRRS